LTRNLKAGSEWWIRGRKFVDKARAPGYDLVLKGASTPVNQIGLKLADGSFYPILQEGVAGRKRLVLTTVRDNQDTVQIDLYRGEGAEVAGTEYLGSLSIEKIQAAPKNDPEIELVLGLDEEGNLSASAADLPAGERRSFAVQLGPTSGAPADLEPEREGSSARVKRGSEEFQEDLLTGETYPFGPGDRRKEHLHRRRRRPLLLVAFVVLALILIAAIAFVVFRSVDGRRIPPLFGGRQASEATVGVAAEGQQPLAEGETSEGQPGAEQPADGEPGAGDGEAGAGEPSAGQAAGTASGSSASETEKKTPGSTVSGGIWHNVRRGDTLWDIAATYYRNPWLYPKIARANKIVNPDLIFAGSKLFVPEP